MTHSSPMTFSPSSRRITRSTPWVAGCCGPILMTSSFVSRNVLSGVSRSSGESVFGSVILIPSVLVFSPASSRSLAFSPARRGISRGAFLSSLPALNPQIDLHPFIVLLQNAVILTQRMPLPPIGQQNPLQVRMPVELDPEHVEYFALKPVGGRPNRHGAGERFAVGDSRGDADAFIPRERVQHPDHIELLLPLGIMHRGNVYAVVELLFVAQNLQNLGNQRAIDHHIVLPEIGQRLDARSVLALKLRDHGRTPWRGHGSRRLRRRCSGLRGRGSRRGCGRCGRWFRRSGRSRSRGGRNSLVWSGFRFRLNRAGRSSLHPARSSGLIRRRFRFTFRRRRRGGFDFVRHSAKAQTSLCVCVKKNVNVYQLEGAKSTSGYVKKIDSAGHCHHRSTYFPAKLVDHRNSR